MLSRLRSYFSRFLEPHLYTAEGFRRTERQYVVPEDSVALPAGERRTIAICNLFANEHKNIDEIAKLLDTKHRSVIAGLIHEGLILDRRHRTRAHSLERRHTVKYHLPLVLPTGHTD